MAREIIGFSFAYCEAFKMQLFVQLLTLLQLMHDLSAITRPKFFGLGVHDTFIPKVRIN